MLPGQPDPWDEIVKGLRRALDEEQAKRLVKTLEQAQLDSETVKDLLAVVSVSFFNGHASHLTVETRRPMPRPRPRRLN